MCLVVFLIPYYVRLLCTEAGGKGERFECIRQYSDRGSERMSEKLQRPPILRHFHRHKIVNRRFVPGRTEMIQLGTEAQGKGVEVKCILIKIC